MEKITLKVGGMSCEHCAKAVTNAVVGITGMDDVDVDLEAGHVSFSYDPAKATLEAIKEAIIGEEFSVN
ncbi:MAG: cation transporter [Treponema sp.]|jgi:copper chaperone|nr:cation transporter [Treponema sp.]